EAASSPAARLARQAYLNVRDGLTRTRHKPSGDWGVSDSSRLARRRVARSLGMRLLGFQWVARGTTSIFAGGRTGITARLPEGTWRPRSPPGLPRPASGERGGAPPVASGLGAATGRRPERSNGPPTIRAFRRPTFRVGDDHPPRPPARRPTILECCSE